MLFQAMSLANSFPKAKNMGAREFGTAELYSSFYLLIDFHNKGITMNFLPSFNLKTIYATHQNKKTKSFFISITLIFKLCA